MKIKINFDQEQVVEPNIVRVSVNGIVMFDGPLINNEITFTKVFDIVSSGRLMDIELLNKPSGSTVMQDGAIVRDSHVTITGIEIDGMKMRYLINDSGGIYPDWDKNPGAAKYFQENEGHVPHYFHKSTKLSLIGKYSFQFTYPIEQWLTEQYIDYDDEPVYNIIKELEAVLEEI